MRKQSAVTGMGKSWMQITPPLSVRKPEILLLQGQDLVLWMRTVELAGAQGDDYGYIYIRCCCKTAHVKREGSNSDKLELIGATAVAVPES